MLIQLLKKVFSFPKSPCWGVGPFQGCEVLPLPPLGSRSAWPITYHPGLAAEVVDGVEGVDSGQPTVLEADD